MIVFFFNYKLPIETIVNYQLFIPKDEIHDEKLHFLSSIAIFFIRGNKL